MTARPKSMRRIKCRSLSGCFLWLRMAMLLMVAGTVWAQDQNRPSADLIITNAKVYTVDKQQPRAEAVAVVGKRIVAVGSASAIDAWRGPGTRVIDAGGKLVLPGFNDAHVHFIDSGLSLASVQLKDAASPQEFAQRIAEFWEAPGTSSAGARPNCPPGS